MTECKNTGTARGGFTLIEILAAVAVLTIGMVSILSLFTTASGMHKRAMDLKYGSMIANHVMDDIRSGFDENAPPTYIEDKRTQEPVASQMNSNYSYSVRITPLIQAATTQDIPYQVLVEVVFRGAEQGQKFYTIIKKKAGKAPNPETY